MSDRLDPVPPNTEREPEVDPRMPGATIQRPSGAPPSGAWQHGAPQRRGLAVASLVVGIVALLLAGVPLVNIAAIIGGVVAVALGVVAIVAARRGTSGGRGLAIAAVAVGAAALMVALVVDTLVGVAFVRAHQSTAAGVAGSTSGQQREDPGSSPAPSGSASATDGTSLALGKPATVGSYTVSITAVNTDADAVIAATNEFNDPPTGQYVLVDVSVVYNGSESTGRPWIDLRAEYLGTDARNYRQCPEVIPRSGDDQPDLRTGGRADYQVCFDVPPTAIAGGSVSVRSFDVLDDSGSAPTWAVPGSSGKASQPSATSSGV